MLLGGLQVWMLLSVKAACSISTWLHQEKLLCGVSTCIASTLVYAISTKTVGFQI